MVANLSHPDTNILKTLYGQPTSLLAVISADKLLGIIVDCLARDNSRSRARMHLEFLAQHLSQTHEQMQGVILEKAFIPYLLFTKPRQKLARVAWSVMTDPSSGLDSHDLLRGCVNLLSTLSDDETSVANLAALNLTLTTKVAG